MKKMIAIAGLAMLTTAASAHDEHFGTDGEMYNNPLVDHGVAEETGYVQRGEGDMYGSILLGNDHAHKKGEGAQKGEGDQYGSILVDIGAL